MTANGYRFLFTGGKCSKIDWGDDYTPLNIPNHWIVHIKWTNGMYGEL